MKGILKAELKRKGVTYAQLVDKLAAVGLQETEPSIGDKLARGKFTTVFMVQVLSAIGSKEIKLN